MRKVKIKIIVSLDIGILLKSECIIIKYLIIIILSFKAFTACKIKCFVQKFARKCKG